MQDEARLNQPAKPTYAYYCFDVLHSHLTGAAPTSNLHIYHLSSEPYPLFVTWNTITSNLQLRLRGCIGTFAKLKLEQGLKDYAVVSKTFRSAVQDHRFAPIKLRELSHILDWSLDDHGINISFPDPNLYPLPLVDSGTSTPSVNTSPTEERSKSLREQITEAKAVATGGKKVMLTATYLPDVANEQGWTKLDTIDSAICKAGWKDTITDALRRTVIVERYQSSKVSVSYSEWLQWRNENGMPLNV